MKDDEVYPYQKKGLTLENNFEEIEKMFADEAAEIGKWEEKKFKSDYNNNTIVASLSEVLQNLFLFSFDYIHIR